MSIGAFSMSLTVKDLETSKAFYEKLGFTDFGGQLEGGWVIMQNGDCTIGLFQGMFDKNMLTFNPGWDNNAKEINPFVDVRVLQEELRTKGVIFTREADVTTEGPEYFMIEDPDGNPILVDQHRGQ